MMNKNLNEIAKKLCESPKGILAADESTNTIKKRLDSINVQSTSESRRDYRELLFTTQDLSNYISGVILFEETLKQEMSDGVLFPKYLISKGIIPGIKVDKGAVAKDPNSTEKITEGLDGLGNRLEEYRSLGAQFTKWRAIIDIDSNNRYPSDYCIEVNAYNLGRYARIVQENEMIPIVEPEVIMDGSHSIMDCLKVTTITLKNVFEQLKYHNVDLNSILLKPNMVISGTNCPEQASPETVAKMTVDCLLENVPKEVPGIVFLSGGQSNELATAHLNEMNKLSNNLPWELSFSYGRALQQPSLKLWDGKKENVKLSQDALLIRSKLNSNATSGDYSSEDEKQMVC